MAERQFQVLAVDLATGGHERLAFGGRTELLGGSGLAAGLHAAFGHPELPAEDPAQPLIFAIGPLTGYFPLMSKVVCGFRSPYHNQYAESHAGGRLALALRFAGLDALVLRGAAATPSCLVVGGERCSLLDVHYLWGMDALETGKRLRTIVPEAAGHRSILRIGPAGEAGGAYACINVDTFRHFGRLGAGGVMGRKRLKAIVVLGDRSAPTPPGKSYASLFQTLYGRLTETDVMNKYHDLGTPRNLIPLNDQRALPWRNLQQTSDPAVTAISGERFADELLLRNSACAGCPIGCIHIGLLREQFADRHHYLYRQVSYDYEPIFAAGTMLGLTRPSDVLRLLETIERAGLDAMSTGVALAWATEALARGVIAETETLLPLRFGEADTYDRAIDYLASGRNAFYERLREGTGAAVAAYGGGEFACLLGQEMAGYATGEVFFTSQAYGFRHSHLDAAGYSFDQTATGRDVDAAVDFLLADERERVLLTSMVACLFARGAYPRASLAAALEAVGDGALASDLEAAAARIQRLRWRERLATGCDLDAIRIPRRFHEVTTWKGPLDGAYLDALGRAYRAALRALAAD